MLEQYPRDVKLVHKFLPHVRELSLKAAEAAVAANGQGKFWEFHDKLFENQSELSENKMVEIADLLKLNVDRFKKEMKDPATSKIIARDLEDSKRLEVHATPWVYLNGRQLENLSLPGFVDAIDKELKK